MPRPPSKHTPEELRQMKSEKLKNWWATATPEQKTSRTRKLLVSYDKRSPEDQLSHNERFAKLWKGKPKPPEQRAKMSAARIGRKDSEITKQRKSEAHKAYLKEHPEILIIRSLGLNIAGRKRRIKRAIELLQKETEKLLTNPPRYLSNKKCIRYINEILICRKDLVKLEVKLKKIQLQYNIQPKE